MCLRIWLLQALEYKISHIETLHFCSWNFFVFRSWYCWPVNAILGSPFSNISPSSTDWYSLSDLVFLVEIHYVVFTSRSMSASGIFKREGKNRLSQVFRHWVNERRQITCCGKLETSWSHFSYEPRHRLLQCL